LIYFFAGLYIAPVAKSTMVPGQNKTMSAIKAPPLIALDGSPSFGFVL
jgi:hypothetical protein